MKFLSIFTTIVFTLILQTASAQSFQVGQQNLHIGIGLGSTFYGNGYRGVLPPISISYEKAIKEKIGVGAYLAYAASRYDYAGYDYHWKYSYTIIGARGAYHFGDMISKNPKLDTYAGAMLGFNIARSKFRSSDPLIDEKDYTSPTAGGFTWSFFAGGRYQIKEKIGVFAELGYGIAWLQVGANVKF